MIAHFSCYCNMVSGIVHSGRGHWPYREESGLFCCWFCGQFFLSSLWVTCSFLFASVQQFPFMPCTSSDYGLWPYVLRVASQLPKISGSGVRGIYIFLTLDAFLLIFGFPCIMSFVRREGSLWNGDWHYYSSGYLLCSSFNHVLPSPFPFKF